MSCECGWGWLQIVAGGRSYSAFSEWELNWQRSELSVEANEDRSARSSRAPKVPMAKGPLYADCEFDFEDPDCVDSAVLIFESGVTAIWNHPSFGINGGLSSRTGEQKDGLIAGHDFEMVRYDAEIGGLAA